MRKQKILAISLVVFFNFLAFYFVFAWTEPSSTPPGSNVSAPINVSSDAQTKEGILGVAGGRDDTYGFTVATSGIKVTGNSWYDNNLSVNGNVGIGTASPNSKLHVSGKTGSVNVLIEADTDNSGENDQPSITLSQDGGAVTGKLGYFDGKNILTLKNIYNDALYLGTNNTNRLIILGNGNVGIGITSPSTKLDVNGGVRIRNLNCSTYTNGGKITTDANGNLTCADDTGGGGGTGDITAVYAGTGLTGGGTSGDVTLNLNTTGISSCTNSTSNKIIWDSSNNRLTCAIDQTGGATGCTDVIRTFYADSGSKAASGCSDTLTIAGGSGISTSISGSTLTITNTGIIDEADTLQTVTDRGNTTTKSIGVGTTSIDSNYRITTSGGGIKAENNDSSNPAGYFSNAGTGPGLVIGSGKLDVNGDINTSGVYRKGGTAGVSSTCPAGQTFSGITTSGGIVTSAGSCVDISGGGGIGGSISTGQVAFGTGTDTIGGDNNLYWDNANKRLGIGKTPGQKLSVAGSMEVPYGFDMYIYGSYNYKNFLKSGWDGTNYADYVYLYAPGNQNSSSVMTLWSKYGGNRVGIGTTTPGYKLDVNGDINTSGVYRKGGTAGVSSTCPAGQTFSGITTSGGIVTSAGSCVDISGGGTSYWTASGDNIYNNNSGNVGIGTSSPTYHFEVYDSTYGSGFFTNDKNNDYVILGYRTSTNYYHDLRLGELSSFFTGDLGIGLKSPGSKLYIYGGAGGGSTPSSSYDLLSIENDASAYLNIITGATNYGGILFSDDARAQGAIFYNHSNDSLIFKTGGTSNRLIVNSNGISIGADSASDDDYIYFDQGNASIYWDNSASRFQISHPLSLGLDDYIVTGSHVSASAFYGGSVSGTTGTFSGQVYSNGANDANKVCQKNGYNCPDMTTYITSASVTVSKNGGSNSTYSPACPTGYAMTGGGCGFNGLGTNVYLNSSYPNSSRGEWYCSGFNGSAVDLTLTAYIVCSRVKQ